jgi:hypothetical protein
MVPLFLLSVGCGGYVQERVVVREPGAVVVTEAPRRVIVQRHERVWVDGYWVQHGHRRVWVSGHYS